MSYMWGINYTKPTAADAELFDRICKEEGGFGYTEVNRRRNENRGINHGEYQGWFTGPNRGNPF